MKEHKKCVDCGCNITKDNKVNVRQTKGGELIIRTRNSCRKCVETKRVLNFIRKQKGKDELHCNQCGEDKEKEIFHLRTYITIEGDVLKFRETICDPCRKIRSRAYSNAYYVRKRKKNAEKIIELDNKDVRFTKKEANDWLNRPSVFDKQKALDWAKVNIPVMQRKKQKLFIEGLDA